MDHTRLETHQQLQAGKLVRIRSKWASLDIDQQIGFCTFPLCSVIIWKGTAEGWYGDKKSLENL